MSISKNLTININMWPVPLHIILFLFLTHRKCTEKILSNINQQNYGTTLSKYYKSICSSKPGENWKTNFWTLFQQLLKITENYTNEDILHHKRIWFAQTYNTFKHWIGNYQISLLYTAAAIIMLRITIFLCCCSSSPLPSTTPDILVAVLLINTIILNNHKNCQAEIIL